MLSLGRAVRNVVNNVRVASLVARHASDLRSRVLLVGLAAALTLKQRTRWRRTTVRVRVNLGGTDYPIRIGTHTDFRVLEEIVVAREYDELPCSDARVIVDLGAHIGLATLRLLAANPNAHVVAVEADPYLVSQLRENVAGLPVTVIHAAIGKDSSPRTFYRSDVFAFNNSLWPVKPEQEPVTVPGITFRELLADTELSHVDLLKVDIEGAEWEAFPEGFPPNVAAVVGEIHIHEGRPPRVLLERYSEEMTLQTGREDDSLLLFSGVRS